MNEALAARLRKALAGRRSVTEKKMFGGACFLLRGNMLCGMGQDKFMFRVGKLPAKKKLSSPRKNPRG